MTVRNSTPLWVDDNNTKKTPAPSPLSDRQVKALKPKETGDYRTPDFPFNGLNLVVKKSGSKKWVFSYISPIKKKRSYWTFGSYPAISLADARLRVVGYRQQVQDNVDPRNHVDQQKKEQAAIDNLGTAQDLFSMYIDDMQLDNRVTYVDVESKYRNYIHKRIGEMPASAITVADAADMLADLANEASPSIVNKCRGYAMTAWTLGLSASSSIRWRKTSKRYDLTSNPWALIKPIPIHGGVDDRCLSKAEVAYLWHHMGADDIDMQLSLAFKFLLSCGQRVEEVMFAEWGEFDLENKIWVMPWQRRKVRQKVRVDHVVPLCQLHLDLLAQIKANSGNSRFLFPPHRQDPNNDKPRVKGALTQAISRYCKKQTMGKGIEKPFAAKVARKCLKTLGARHLQLSLEDRNRVQGHSFSDVGSKHYDKYSYEIEKRACLQRWCDWLEEITQEARA